MPYATGTITGTYKLTNGAAASGTVTFIPNAALIKDTSGAVVLSGVVEVTLDAAGSFSQVLPATTDTSLDPTGFSYTAVVALRHGRLPEIKGITLAGGQTRTMASLTTADPAAPAYVPAVASVNGKTGVVVLAAADIGGLGTAATRNVGTGPGTVAAGDDSRFGAGGGGAKLSPGYKSGQWILPPAVGITTFADNGNNGYFVPLMLAEATAVNAIAIELTAAGTNGAVKRLGAYSAGADGMPSTLLFDAGTTGAQVTGLQTLTVTHTLPAGLVWLYCQGQLDVTGVQPTHRGMTACAFPHAQQGGYEALAFNGYYTLAGPTLTTSPLPSAPPAVSGLAGSGTPFVVVRKA